ncbi:sensor histidine kinase [Anthocerotibacter panamensis]|uniref:sensor histidine kinase n=1 Tax=Anthocerotibacter panamensis TaxID=2857077 RepID=UPI001C405B8B|nr:HAMP domain-containing sensor histidine kinase [Anthocerotibacter panamensis]
MKRFAALVEQSFYTAIRWCLKHQAPALLVILLAVVIPIGTLNVLEYRSMAKFEKDSTETVQNQLQYILGRLVLEVHDSLRQGGGLWFHSVVDREHVELLKGNAVLRQKIVNTLQDELHKQLKDFSKELLDPMIFVLAPKSGGSWQATFPKRPQDKKYNVAALNSRDYFISLKSVEQDVGYLFYYDEPSASLILLHPISSQKLHSFEEEGPPRPIQAVMGVIFPREFLSTKQNFESLTRRGKVNRFYTTPMDDVIANANYNFRVRDERGNLIFTDLAAGQDWEKLSKQGNYITSDLTITPEQKFLTGWQFSVMTRSNLQQITNFSLGQMYWASGLVAIALVLLLVITLRAGLVAVKVSDMKSDIVSGVSHDLKTPLAGIIASAQLLASGRVSGKEETQQFSGYIVTEAQRLTEVVEKVLTLAKLESRQLKMKPAAITVPELVDQAIQSISRAFPDAMILKGGIPRGVIYGDSQALTTVLVNLMENSIRYSKDRAWVKIQAFWSQHGEKRTLHVQVEDHGVGIPAHEQPFIFQKFYRVRNGLVTDTDGTGLGLAIASQIIRAHHGHIHVESEVGVGSKFIVRLPYERPNFGS